MSWFYHFNPNHIRWHFRTSLSKLVISHSLNSPNEALGCGDSPLLLNGPTTNKNINKWYSLCCTPPYSKLKNASWITTTKIRFFHAHVKQGYWKCSTRLLRSYIFLCTSFKIRDLVFFLVLSMLVYLTCCYWLSCLCRSSSSP